MNSPSRLDPCSTSWLFKVATASVDPEGSDRWDAIWALHYRADRTVLETARALSFSLDRRARSVAADVLGQLGIPRRAFSDECFLILRDMLSREADPVVKPHVAWAVAHLDHRAGAGILAGLKNNPDPEVRWAVTYGLSQWWMGRERESVPTLIKLTRDPVAKIRDWATFGLGSQLETDSPEIRTALTVRLQDPDDATREEAMLGLAKRKDRRVIRYLIRELSKKSVAYLAIEAAGEFSDPRMLPGLLRIRERSARFPEWVRKDLFNAIHRCNSQRRRSRSISRRNSKRR